MFSFSFLADIFVKKDGVSSYGDDNLKSSKPLIATFKANFYYCFKKDDQSYSDFANNRSNRPTCGLTNFHLLLFTCLHSKGGQTLI